MVASLRLTVAALVAWTCVCGAARARAADPVGAAAVQVPAAADDVDRHAALAERHLEHGRYQDAIAEFRRAYELRAEPRLLLGIGDSYRLLGIVDRALFFYERYLAAVPDEAPERPQVERKIAELESVRSRAAAAAAPPALAPNLARDVVIVPVAGRPDDGDGARGGGRDRAGAAPLWRRWWFWTALGGAVAAGVVTGLVLGTRDDGGPPATALGDRRFY